MLKHNPDLPYLRLLQPDLRLLHVIAVSPLPIHECFAVLFPKAAKLLVHILLQCCHTTKAPQGLVHENKMLQMPKLNDQSFLYTQGVHRGCTGDTQGIYVGCTGEIHGGHTGDTHGRHRGGTGDTWGCRGNADGCFPLAARLALGAVSPSIRACCLVLFGLLAGPRGRTQRSVRAVQLCECLAVLKTHILRYWGQP